MPVDVSAVGFRRNLRLGAAILFILTVAMGPGSGCGAFRSTASEGGKSTSPSDASALPTVVCKITGGFLGGDEITPFPDGKGVRLRINRRGGISRAEITRVDGDWPYPIRLEFVDFGNLESLHVYYGEIFLASSIRAAPAVAVNDRVNGNDPSRGNEFKMPMKRDGLTITVELPDRLFTKEVKTFQLEWIDAYR